MNERITLFLDIDGVMCTVKQFNMTDQHAFWMHGDFFSGRGVYPFDGKCVEVLNGLLWQFECDIVVSSDWRLYCTLEELQEIFKLNGVVSEPIGVTDHHPTSMSDMEKNRAGEITKYVKDNEVTKYIAIDDLDLHGFLGSEHFALCNTDWEGIKQSGLKDKIINKLNKQIT